MEKASEILLLPSVNEIKIDGGIVDFQLPLFLELPKELFCLSEAIEKSFGGFFKVDGAEQDCRTVRFFKNASIPKEGYVLTVDKTTTVEYSEPSGAFYALMTFRQLLFQKTVPRCRISDAPSLKVRGFMLDVSRGKIPKLSSLKELVDLLASFKYNHFELYFEGMPFSYPSYREYAVPCAYLPDEIAELDAYCRARCIELVPNFNTLGHMSPFLRLPRFRPLAEKEEGLSFFGRNAPPTTLDCEDPNSLKFVLSLADDLLPCFRSRFVNVGLDEPFELGKGKNFAKAEKFGADALYFGYVKRLHAAMRERGRTMMMWGDTVSRDFQKADELPDDVILMEWGYQAEYPFQAHAKELRRAGKRFLLCPGTSSWLSVGGITDNMIRNIENAAEAARESGALGMVLTDWGDGGHIQIREISYPAILLFAARSWAKNGAISERDVCRALDRFVFRDEAGVLGGVLFDVGRYSKFEEVSLDTRTVATLPLLFPEVRGERCLKLIEGIKALTLQMIAPDLKERYREKMSVTRKTDAAAFDAFLKELSLRLQKARPACADGAHIMRQLRNTIALIGALTRAWSVLKDDAADAELGALLRAEAEELRRLWTVKNRVCGVEQNYDNLLKLADNVGGKQSK